MSTNKPTSKKPQLNLARSWRPVSFDAIVGQELSVRILKNGLFLNKLFPVYLFAGQRGCGKTSTARVFAAAVNCDRLADWREKPKSSLPCLECESCTSMRSAAHPDFIEMDAASHTGVDDIRQLTESASYVPLIADKKVYLIDEAHMLSKAAFNAFLKILEEPPPRVLFILATTELHKIPETVRSRCFQVMFNPIIHTTVTDHLEKICAHEEIDIETDALALVAHETQGSLRDAINLLEKVRFLDAKVTRELVLKTLGKLSEQAVYELAGLVLAKKTKQMLTFLQNNAFEQLNPTTLWYSLVDLVRLLMRIRFGVKKIDHSFFRDANTLQGLANSISTNRLHAILQLMWNQEHIFLRTHQKHHFIEMLLIQISQQVAVKDLEQLLADLPTPAAPTSSKRQTSRAIPAGIKQSLGQSFEEKKKSEQVELTPEVQTQPSRAEQQDQNSAQPIQGANPWDEVVTFVQTLNDPLLNTFFKQLHVKSYEPESKKLTLLAGRTNNFFMEKFEQTKPEWLAVVHKHYPEAVIRVEQDSQSASIQPLKKSPPRAPQPSYTPPTRPAPESKKNTSFSPRHSTYGRPQARKAEYIAVNEQDWPKAHLIATTFSARIEKVASSE